MNFKKIEYKPLYAGEARQHPSGIDGAIAGRTGDILLFGNPDRGFRTTLPIPIAPIHRDPEDPTKPCEHCDLIYYHGDGKATMNNNSKCLGKHPVHCCYANLPLEENERIIDYMVDNWFFDQAKTDYVPKLTLLQATFVGVGPMKEIPQIYLDILDCLFDKFRARDCKVLFRYGYHGVQYNWKVSEENRRKFDGLGVSEENILAHIDQIVPFIEKNKDIIHKLSSGFIGSGGEQAYNYQYPVVNYDTIIKAVVEKLCVPFDFYYTVRMPQYKLDLLEHEPDYKYADIIGFNNDAMFGETENYGWNSGCYQYKHNFETVEGEHKCIEADWGGTHVPNDWWEYVCQNAAYTPQSGEMFHMQAIKRPERVPSGMDVIKEVAHQRYVTMSQWNGFVEARFEHFKKNGKLVSVDSTMQRWINNETVTAEDLDREGIIYDPAWFTDQNGNPVHRNPYEYIRDHLGYRLKAKDFTFDGKTANLTLVNYGFAAAFNLKSGFVVLDENYNVVSDIPAGEPHKWYSHDPDNYHSTEILEHNITAEISVPDDKKCYYIGFYAKNTREEYARFANDPDSLPFENNKYNILYTIG